MAAQGPQYGSIPVKDMLEVDGTSSRVTSNRMETGFLINLSIVALCTMCGDSSRGVFFPTLWLFVETLGGNHEDQGIAVALFSAGRIVSSPIFGYIGERIGYRRVLIVSNLLTAFGCILYMTASHLHSLFIAQFTIGIGCGILGVTRAYVAERSHVEDRTVNLAYLTSAQYSAFTVLPILGGVLAEYGRTHHFTDPIFHMIHFDEFSVPALFIFGLSLICSFLMAFVFDDKVRSEPDAPSTIPVTNNNINRQENGQSLGPTGSDQQTNYIDYAALGLSTMVMNIGGMALNVSTKGTIGVYETMGSLLAVTKLDWNTEQVGNIFALFGAIGTGMLFCFRFFL
jgi:ceroid-lipofuscinosis MFS transporter 7